VEELIQAEGLPATLTHKQLMQLLEDGFICEMGEPVAYTTWPDAAGERMFYVTLAWTAKLPRGASLTDVEGMFSRMRARLWGQLQSAKNQFKPWLKPHLRWRLPPTEEVEIAQGGHLRLLLRSRQIIPGVVWAHVADVHREGAPYPEFKP
jgi:hypothetical protein